MSLRDTPTTSISQGALLLQDFTHHVSHAVFIIGYTDKLLSKILVLTTIFLNESSGVFLFVE